jgi:hypothetical protein
MASVRARRHATLVLFVSLPILPLLALGAILTLTNILLFILERRVVFELAVLGLVLLAAGGVLMLSFRRRIHLLPPGADEKGRCRACAYDLTNNTTGICPECGRNLRTGDIEVP